MSILQKSRSGVDPGMGAVITVENLGKKYLIGHQRCASRGALRDAMTHVARGLWQRVRHPLSPNRETLDLEEMWALRNVSFEVRQGERVGIIGRNGAGKSTLLKVLSRITQPTTGRVHLRGRVSSLLEVGTGFHPELTGRENIFLNGAVLGMTRQEIRKKFDEIVAFAEIERFLDTPAKHYSSGMYVRLAFAVAAHLEPEILIVDEVLAVGDAPFQKKCLGRMGQVSREGRTVLFVSHNMTAVRSFCQRGLMLVAGALASDGPAASVIARYVQEAQDVRAGQEWSDPQNAPGDDVIRIKRVQVLADDEASDGLLTMDTPLRVETEFWAVQKEVTTHLTYHLINEQGVTVLTTGCPPSVREPGVYKASWWLPAQLLNSGGYSLKLLVVRNENQVTYEKDEIASFSLADASSREHACMGREPGVVQPPLPWVVERAADACLV